MKKIWNGIKGSTRIASRIIVEAVHRLAINIFDTLFGFLNWPEKKLRIKIVILQDPQANPVVSSADLETAIAYAKRSFKKNFNTRLLPYKSGQPFAEVLQRKVPYKPSIIETNDPNSKAGIVASNLSSSTA